MNTLRLKHYIQLSPFWQLELLSIVLVLIQAALIYLRIEPTDKLLILHYSIPFGIDLIGPYYQLYYIPLLGIIFLTLTTLTSFALFVKYRMFAIVAFLICCISEGILLTGVILLTSQNS